MMVACAVFAAICCAVALMFAMSGGAPPDEGWHNPVVGEPDDAR